MHSLDISKGILDENRFFEKKYSLASSLGSNQVFFIPRVCFCLNNVAKHVFAKFSINDSSSTLTTDEKYERKVKKIYEYNQIVFWISELAFNLLSIVPFKGPSWGRFIQEKISCYRIECTIKRTRGDELNLTNEELVDCFHVNPEILKQPDMFNNHVKHRLILQEEIWPGIDRTHVKNFHLHTMYINESGQ